MKTSFEKSDKAHWSGIWALTLGVSGLMIAEFLPAGVLTPMASDLGITEGMAGQSVTATSVFAVLSSLSIAYLTRKYNRKDVLLLLSALLIISSGIAALTPNLPFLLFGRVLLGIALGGFWSMATAIAIRLVPTESVPKALSIIFGGASFSAVLAAPLGSYLGNIIGWRNVFLFAAAVGVIGFIWLFISLPSLKPKGEVKLRTILDVLKIPSFTPGLFAITLAFCGRFASITYLRPFLEQKTGLEGNSISVVFLAFDLSYFIGTLFATGMVKKNLRLTLFLPSIVLAICSIGLFFSGKILVPTVLLIVVLGAVFAPIPVSWSTWIAKTAPENTETAGGLYVAAVQFSAGIGAMLGGAIFDVSGPAGVFSLSSITWIFSAIVVLLFIKTPKYQNRGNEQLSIHV
ncbi:MFS transporter [Bacteriovorax sp. PP10]|uniref:MFS transporter n=1 Tax=Bacteriovorax antarcticus TaxID=3088717 RepID=A0ABU5VZN4_9BACT|nr:MFS transporter [Bacteriovorax sp. PP10]MEA9358407.1 MFS transporter [Bacteriovorax sp. PP10]